LQDLRREYQPQIFEVFSNADGQLTAILTPEQQARFQQWKDKNRSFWPAVRPDH
jgi:Spy/CpxP family protein refolding chaperone